jgi:hypothetical protein
VLALQANPFAARGQFGPDPFTIVRRRIPPGRDLGARPRAAEAKPGLVINLAFPDAGAARHEFPDFPLKAKLASDLGGFVGPRKSRQPIICANAPPSSKPTRNLALAWFTNGAYEGSVIGALEKSRVKRECGEEEIPMPRLPPQL